MKKIHFIMLTALALLTSGFADKGIWIIDAGSKLTIEGFTNINNFVCTIEYWPGTDTLQYVSENSNRELRFTRSCMTLPVRSFDCGAHPISKDFWKTLKAESYPNMKINFVSLQNLYFKNNRDIKGIVDITLAGVTTRHTIIYHASIKDNGTVLLNGTHEVNFSDFSLEAPEKLNGLIKVKEGLIVCFNLVLRSA